MIVIPAGLEVYIVVWGVIYIQMSLEARKPVFGGLGTTKTQTNLCIYAVWSAPLLFTFWKESYLNLLQEKV